MKPQKNAKQMSIKEFKEAGYLQEANRQFFHPLGLELGAYAMDYGTYVLGGVLDFRDRPEGYKYNDRDLATPEAVQKAMRVLGEATMRSKPRMDALGYIVQPISRDL